MFRLLLARFQSAETTDDFAKHGYRWLLIGTVPIAILITVLLPDHGSIAIFSGILAEYLKLPSTVTTLLPTPLTFLILVWSLGRAFPPVWRLFGGVSGRALLQGADRFAGLGERLAGSRILAFSLVIVFLALGFLAWHQHSRWEAYNRRQTERSDMWVSQASSIIRTSTHSIRDIRSFASVIRQPQHLEGVPHGDPVACLQDIAFLLFAPLDDSFDRDVVRGIQWSRRMRRVLKIHSEGLCSTISPANAYPSHLTSHEAASLYHILVGRSFTRLAGEDCSDSWALEPAFAAFEKASDSLHSSSRENGLGNIHACIARLLARGEPVSPAILGICKSIRDCYQSALESYRAAASPYRLCSFEHLRSTNNTADLATKLSLIKWRDQETERLRFLRDSALFDALTISKSTMIRCLGVVQAPTEVTVTIAQVFGALAHNPSIDPTRTNRLEEKSALFLAFSLLHAPEELQAWDLQGFCPSLPDSSGIERFLATIQAAEVSSSVVDELRERLKTQCHSLN